MKTSYSTLSILTVTLVAISIGILSLMKCNFENKTLHSEAGDQTQQVDAASPSPQPQDNIIPSPRISANNAIHNAYWFEKTTPPRAADSGVNIRYLGPFYYRFRSPDASKVYQGLRPDGEYIGSLQDSPNAEQTLFYDRKVEQWQVWSIQDSSPSKLVAEPPREVGSLQIFSWHWLDNDRLIGQHHAMFDPPIEGYDEEGWTESTALHIFDLRTLAASAVGWPPSLTTTEKQFKIDPLSDGNTLTVPLKRYYAIHSVSDRGELHLVSLDTTKPEGGNQRDEGWFILKHR